MSVPMSAQRLLDILREAGLKVVEVGNWRTWNRNHMGPWGPVYGVMVHHTVTEGTAATVRICRDGHASLPGPLCHIVVAKDGTLHLVGHGRANHAGLGDDDVLRAVMSELSAPAVNENNTDGNRHFYGLECENLGNGIDPWPIAQLQAIEKASAAICREHGWSHQSVIGHKQWQVGKIDPKGFSMDSMREQIRHRLESNSPEDDMTLTDDQIKKIATATAMATHSYRNKAANDKSMAETGKPIPDAYGYDVQTHSLAKSMAAQIGALTATVTKLVEGGGLDAAEIQAAAEAGARAALAELGEALTPEA